MKGHLFGGVSSRRSCRASQNHSTSASSTLLAGADLDYCDSEWFTLETNRDHSVIFDIAPKNLISDSSVDYEGYSISSSSSSFFFFNIVVGFDIH